MSRLLPACLPACSLSPLAIQTRNLLEDPRCSVVVQMPGWTGLANARVTIFGEVHKLPGLELQEQAQEVGAPVCLPGERWCWQLCHGAGSMHCTDRRAAQCWRRRAAPSRAPPTSLRIVSLPPPPRCCLLPSRLPSPLQIFHAKHATRANRAERYVSGNAVHFRMNRILDIYFVGGFGTVQVRGAGCGAVPAPPGGLFLLLRPSVGEPWVSSLSLC
jgi:hypothetical protein